MSWRVFNAQNRSALIHYGVLGMKWGVRRYQPYPEGKHGTFLGKSRDEDIRIEKGTKAYRLQEGSEFRDGQLYVSFDTLDHYTYIAQTAAREGGLSIDLSDGKGESIRLVLDRDIVAPSYKATMDAFIKTVSDMNGPKNFAKETFVSGWKAGDLQRTKEFVRNMGMFKGQDGLDNAYLQFAKTLMSDTKARKLFYDNLKEQGYNAIIDENDKQFGSGMSEAPIILFDASYVKKVGSKTINEKDLEYFNDLVWGGGQDPKKHGFESSKKYWEKFAGDEKKEN